MTNQQTQCVIERSEAVRLATNHASGSTRSGSPSFFSLFFHTGPENGAVDIRLQIQQEGLLLLARHRASGEAGRNESNCGTAQQSTAPAVFCFVLLGHGHVALLIGISREDSRRITNAIQSGGACFISGSLCICVCINSLLTLVLSNGIPAIGKHSLACCHKVVGVICNEVTPVYSLS